MSQLDTWHLDEDPTDPQRPPRAYPYAAVGRPNAVISLAIADLTGAEIAVDFEMEYLVTAGWDAHGPYVVGLTRDQRTQRWLAIEPFAISGRRVQRAEPEWTFSLHAYL